MRRFAPACVLLLLLAAPIAEATITLPVPWKEGMQLRYRSSSTQEKVKGKLHTRVQTQDETAIDILAGADGFVQRWRSIKPEVAVTGDGDQVAAERRMTQALLKRFAGLAMEAKIDAAGNYQGLGNWQELGAAMREVMLPVMLEQASKRKELAGVEPELIRSRMVPALEKMTSQAAVDAALGRQVAIFNYFVAPSLARGKVETYEDSMPSPWSADVIPTRGRVEVLAVDERADTVTIRWQQSIDPVKGAAVAWRMVEAITGVKQAQMEATRGMPKGMELRDEATVVLSRSSGLPLRLEHRRHVALGNASNSNHWTFEKLPDRAAK